MSAKSSKDEDRGIVIFLAVAAFVASIVYSPQRIRSDAYDPLPGNPYSHVVPAVDRVEYAFIWNPPENSSLDFGRLAVTWAVIAVVATAIVYTINRSKNYPPGG